MYVPVISSVYVLEGMEGFGVMRRFTTFGCGGSVLSIITTPLLSSVQVVFDGHPVKDRSTSADAIPDTG